MLLRFSLSLVTRMRQGPPKLGSSGRVFKSTDGNNDLIPIGKFNFRVTNEMENSIKSIDPLEEEGGELVHHMPSDEFGDNTFEAALDPADESYGFETLESLQNRLLQREFALPDEEVCFDEYMDAILKREYFQQVHPYFGEFWEKRKRRRISWYISSCKNVLQSLTSRLFRRTKMK